MRSSKTLFPEHPNPDLVEEWLNFGRSLDLTEEEVQLGLINCRFHHLGEGSRKADWTPVVQKWLMGDRDRKRQRAKGMPSARMSQSEISNSVFVVTP
jgi:hypothetical protein